MCYAKVWKRSRGESFKLKHNKIGKFGSRETLFLKRLNFENLDLKLVNLVFELYNTPIFTGDEN